MFSNDSQTLRSCPFCGGEAHLCEDYSSELDERRYNVWHDCEGFEGESNGYGYSLHPWFETPWYRDKATALAAWNRRADERITELGDENAKLRNLMSELYQCSRQYGCDRCGYRDGCTMFDRMRELGVEVN